MGPAGGIRLPVIGCWRSRLAPPGTPILWQDLLPETRQQCLDNHVKSVRQTIEDLAQKEYWRQFEVAPEFIVMFMSSDGPLHVAFERDPTLLQFSFDKRVLITTPVTLLALLKCVAYGWQQHRLTEHARSVIQEAKTLHDRLATFLGHFRDVGKKLQAAVQEYNQAVGSLQHRLMPSARRFQEMVGASQEVPEIAAVSHMPALPPAGGVDGDGDQLDESPAGSSSATL